MNIVLDVDSTLIYNIGRLPIPRPYLEEFFLFCFANFSTVSIWTAASTGWFLNVYGTIFQPILQKHNLEFFFIWTKEECNYIKFGEQIYVVKPLEKVWNTYREMNNKNTLIIDDSPITCALNTSNSILIHAWKGEPGDEELKTVKEKILQKKEGY